MKIRLAKYFEVSELSCQFKKDTLKLEPQLSGDYMTNWFNYFLSSKNSRLTNGHLKASDLYQKILDHDGTTAYCCYFDLDENLLKLEWDTQKVDRDGKKIYEYHLSGQTPKNPDYKCNGKTFTQYEGICRPALNMVSFDFDSEDPQDSLDDVRKFVAWLDIDDAIVFFSGSKGFHVMVPFGYFDLEPNEHLPNQLKDLAKHLEKEYPTLDTSIYNYNRKFRVPFTEHEKSGLYKYGCIIDDDFTIEHYISAANKPGKDDFLPTKTDQSPLPQITEAIEQSKRISYEIEKEKAGTKEAPSNFEKFDNKLCIKKLLESRCDDVGRNNAAIRIVNDYYRTGKPQKKCETDLALWSNENGLPLSEVSEIISNIYERGQNYNFGCQDEIKSLYCSAKCDIWKKLDPDKRPITVDSPTNTGNAAQEFNGVTWLMENIFAATWDDGKGKFNLGSIIKQDAGNLFYYKDNHWQHLKEDKIHILKTKLNAAYNNKLTTRKLDSIFKMFILYVPAKPEEIDLFSPQNDMANFLDGTLHLKKVNGSYELNFKSHNRLDFCTTIIEQNYNDYLNDPGRVNSQFDEWLKEYLNNDEECYKLVQEMFGASLMPKFPQFFFLLGKSGTGKSTTIKMLKQLHKNENNISGVSPDKFHGFHMGSMIGKLMNIVGDIKTNCKIDDDVVKQVDDQEVVRIEVKQINDVYTKLPALQIFGANKMPRTEEGYSGAMTRRVSVINYDKVFEGKQNSNIAKEMFESDPLGVLCFALRGLHRLVILNEGRYSKTEKSTDNVTKWTKKEDIIQTFLSDICEEAVDDANGKPHLYALEVDSKTSAPALWDAFDVWQQVALEQRNLIGRTAFYNRLEDAGYPKRRMTKGNFILGVKRVEGSDDSI